MLDWTGDFEHPTGVAGAGAEESIQGGLCSRAVHAGKPSPKRLVLLCASRKVTVQKRVCGHLGPPSLDTKSEKTSPHPSPSRAP